MGLGLGLAVLVLWFEGFAGQGFRVAVFCVAVGVKGCKKLGLVRSQIMKCCPGRSIKQLEIGNWGWGWRNHEATGNR